MSAVDHLNFDFNSLDSYCSFCGGKNEQTEGLCCYCGHLMNFGSNGLKHFGLQTIHGYAECWAQSEKQVEGFFKDKQINLESIEQIGECEVYTLLPIDCGEMRLYYNVHKNPGGCIQSNLKMPEIGDDEDAKENHDYNIAIDAIESLVLAHACAGVIINFQTYLEGLNVAIETCASKL